MINIAKYKFLKVLLVGTIMFTACDKTRNELPPVSVPPTVLTIPVPINGVERFSILLEQDKYNDADTINVYVVNIVQDQDTTSQIDSASIFLEITTGEFRSYDKCKQSPVLKIEALKGTTKKKLFSYYNKNLTLSAKNVKVGVVKFGEESLPFAGVYDLPVSLAEFYTDTVYHYSAQARGYILYDGSATFHIKAADTAQYDIEGNFSVEGSFSGLQYLDGKVGAQVFSDSVTNANDSLVPTNFDGNRMHCNLSLTHPLSDNVDHISLKLKK